MMRETEDRNQWKNNLCSWIGRLTIVKMSMLSKATYAFNVNPTKMPTAFSIEVDQTTPNSYGTTEDPK